MRTFCLSRAGWPCHFQNKPALGPHHHASFRSSDIQSSTALPMAPPLQPLRTQEVGLSRGSSHTCKRDSLASRTWSSSSLCPLMTQGHPQKEHPGRLSFFFLQRLYCLTCLTKKLQPQSSYAKMIEEQATIFQILRTFNEFSLKDSCLHRLSSPHKNMPYSEDALGKLFFFFKFIGLGPHRSCGAETAHGSVFSLPQTCLHLRHRRETL